jgi:hypothetical protein
VSKAQVQRSQDTKGNTPDDMAAVVDDQDLLVILDQSLKALETNERNLHSTGFVALSADISRPVELADSSDYCIEPS